MKAKNPLAKEKKDALKVAKELGYSSDIIEKITNATNCIQIDNTLIQARKQMVTWR